jgi:hypothetical protein
MRASPLRAALQAQPAEQPDEARLAQRRVVQATLAGFAEMDHLLDRAERLLLQKCSDCAANMLQRRMHPA